jgi:hypothetical protein
MLDMPQELAEITQMFCTTRRRTGPPNVCIKARTRVEQTTYRDGLRVFTVGKTSGSWGNNKREKPEKGGAGTKSLEKVLRKHLGQELRGRDNEKGKGKKTRKRDTETDGKDRRERGTKGIGKRDGKEE